MEFSKLIIIKPKSSSGIKINAGQAKMQGRMVQEEEVCRYKGVKPSQFPVVPTDSFLSLCSRLCPLLVLMDATEM